MHAGMWHRQMHMHTHTHYFCSSSDQSKHTIHKVSPLMLHIWLCLWSDTRADILTVFGHQKILLLTEYWNYFFYTFLCTFRYCFHKCLTLFSLLLELSSLFIYGCYRKIKVLLFPFTFSLFSLKHTVYTNAG